MLAGVAWVAVVVLAAAAPVSAQFHLSNLGDTNPLCSTPAVDLYRTARHAEHAEATPSAAADEGTLTLDMRHATSSTPGGLAQSPAAMWLGVVVRCNPYASLKAVLTVEQDETMRPLAQASVSTMTNELSLLVTPCMHIAALRNNGQSTCTMLPAPPGRNLFRRAVVTATGLNKDVNARNSKKIVADAWEGGVVLPQPAPGSRMSSSAHTLARLPINAAAWQVQQGALHGTYLVGNGTAQPDDTAAATNQPARVTLLFKIEWSNVPTEEIPRLRKLNVLRARFWGPPRIAPGESAWSCRPPVIEDALELQNSTGSTIPTVVHHSTDAVEAGSAYYFAMEAEESIELAVRITVTEIPVAYAIEPELLGTGAHAGITIAFSLMLMGTAFAVFLVVRKKGNAEWLDGVPKEKKES